MSAPSMEISLRSSAEILPPPSSLLPRQSSSVEVGGKRSATVLLLRPLPVEGERRTRREFLLLILLPSIGTGYVLLGLLSFLLGKG